MCVYIYIESHTFRPFHQICQSFFGTRMIFFPKKSTDEVGDCLPASAVTVRDLCKEPGIPRGFRGIDEG